MLIPFSINIMRHVVSPVLCRHLHALLTPLPKTLTHAHTRSWRMSSLCRSHWAREDTELAISLGHLLLCFPNSTTHPHFLSLTRPLSFLFSYTLSCSLSFLLFSGSASHPHKDKPCLNPGKQKQLSVICQPKSLSCQRKSEMDRLPHSFHISFFPLYPLFSTI